VTTLEQLVKPLPQKSNSPLEWDIVTHY
jgi:hypothetical protein